MSSIGGFNPFASMYQAFEIGGIDSDKPRHNPLISQREMMPNSSITRPKAGNRRSLPATGTMRPLVILTASL